MPLGREGEADLLVDGNFPRLSILPAPSLEVTKAHALAQHNVNKVAAVSFTYNHHESATSLLRELFPNPFQTRAKFMVDVQFPYCTRQSRVILCSSRLPAAREQNRTIQDISGHDRGSAKTMPKSPVGFVERDRIPLRAR